MTGSSNLHVCKHRKSNIQDRNNNNEDDDLEEEEEKNGAGGGDVGDDDKEDNDDHGGLLKHIIFMRTFSLLRFTKCIKCT